MSLKVKMNLLITMLVVVAEMVSGYSRYPMDTTTHAIAHNYGSRDFTLKSHSGISPLSQPITPSPEDYDEYGAVSQWGGRVPRHQPPFLRNHVRYSYSDHSNYVNANSLDDGFQSDQAPVGEVTADKMNRLGTPDAVPESRRTFPTQTSSPSELAMKHLTEIRREGRCRIPRKELVYMNEETNVQYFPRATFLHRCSKFSGCCELGYLCQAKNNTVEIVEKYFYVAVNVNDQGAKPRLIQLQNHTECECVKINEIRRKRSTSCQCPKHFTDFSLSESQWGERINTVLAQEQRCRCDCHLNNETCKRLKNGDEGFSVMERRRMQRGESSPPFCNYGLYDMKNGRCPRLYQHSNTNPSLQHHHQFQSKGHNGNS
ncbi:uncharacterized protein Dana_GF24471 [Drosophila ananassae]|uniref:Uncharacterized protein n=2 Tax=Drosophila ananassae TaxID=7217 RepID=B3MUB3_DROAN|nr:uncharacterized protein LOC6507103 isoform X1 [Drosophila ananassae]EDV33442.2 uncharacterized protein Dana_GF24471 [Drosophila ananassae]